MPDPPSGTVTYLFTDIEGSTRLRQRNPAEMREALAGHDAPMRTATAAMPVKGGPLH